MENLKFSQSLIWAIIHKNPSNSFYAITAKSKKKQTCDEQQQQTCDWQNDYIDIFFVSLWWCHPPGAKKNLKIPLIYSLCSYDGVIPPGTTKDLTITLIFSLCPYDGLISQAPYKI